MSKNGTIKTLVVAGLTALTLHQMSKKEPKTDNIVQLCVKQEDKDRLAYLQAAIRGKLESPKVIFDDWQEKHPFPEYDNFTVDQIIDEKNNILRSYGYGSSTLQWHFRTSKDEKIFSEEYVSKYQPIVCDIKDDIRKKTQDEIEIKRKPDGSVTSMARNQKTP